MPWHICMASLQLHFQNADFKRYRSEYDILNPTSQGFLQIPCLKWKKNARIWIPGKGCLIDWWSVISKPIVQKTDANKEYLLIFPSHFPGMIFPENYIYCMKLREGIWNTSHVARIVGVVKQKSFLSAADRTVVKLLWNLKSIHEILGLEGNASLDVFILYRAVRFRVGGRAKRASSGRFIIVLLITFLGGTSGFWTFWFCCTDGRSSCNFGVVRGTQMVSMKI